MSRFYFPPAFPIVSWRRKRWSSLETSMMLSAMVKGFSHREIANALHRTPKAVERRVYRIKQRRVNEIMDQAFDAISKPLKELL